jgi:WD40 repeat protein
LPADHWVHRLAVAPDGSTLATGGLSGGGVPPARVLIREWATGKLRWKLDPEMQEVKALAYSLDGKTLAVGGQKVHDRRSTGVIQIWSVETGKLLGQREVVDRWVSSVVFSRQGLFVASAGDGGSLQLWHAQTLKELYSLTGHTGDVRCLSLSPDDTLLATGSADGTIRTWHAGTGKEKMVLRANSPVNCLAFTPDGRTLASENGVATLWQVSTGQELLLLDHTFPVNSLAFAPDGQVLAVGSGWRDENEGVKLWHTFASTAGRGAR